MIILIDTHAFIWWTLNPEKLSEQDLQLLDDSNNQILLSIASVWEMQIKLSLGKLNLALPLPQLLNNQIQVNNLQILPIELEHIWTLEGLSYHHKDPFDRILIAQGIYHKIPLMSVDDVFDHYPVDRLWQGIFINNNQT